MEKSLGEVVDFTGSFGSFPALLIGLMKTHLPKIDLDQRKWHVVDADGANSSRVAVTYQSINMIPIPGLMGRLTLTRTAQMRLKGP